jgi:hypothetical protein
MDDTVAFAHELKARGVDVIDCSSGGIAGAATAAQVTRSLGFQVLFAERVRKEADQDPPGLCHAHRRRYAPAVIPASAVAVKTLNKAVVLARPMIGKRERIEAWQDFKKRESTQGSGVAHHPVSRVFVSIFSRLSQAPFWLSVIPP